LAHGTLYVVGMRTAPWVLVGVLLAALAVALFLLVGAYAPTSGSRAPAPAVATPAATELPPGQIAIPAAGARLTLPVHVLARVGAPGDAVTVTLRWRDGTQLTNTYLLRAGSDGRGLLIENVEWLQPGQRPPRPPTQAAELTINAMSGALLAQQRVTVVSEDDPSTQLVTLYWYWGETLRPEQRRIPPVDGGAARVAQGALEELLWGPPPGRLAGYATALPTPDEVLGYPGRTPDWGPRVVLRGLTIRDGVATADFSRELRAYGGGATRVAQIREQVTRTLLQFPAIHEVRIAVEGETEGVLEP
jgi:hypothetical protein